MFIKLRMRAGNRLVLRVARCLVSLPVLVVIGIDLSSAAETRPSFARFADQAGSELSRIVGNKACLDCHKSETAALLQMQHGKSLEKLQAAPNSKLYAKNLDIEAAEIAVAGRCASCHATQQRTAEHGVRAISSISCESCHGAAGGDDGWLNRHAVYGAKGTKIDEETNEHRRARIEHCEKAGMIRAPQLYQIAKNCLGCHIVPDEHLVNQGGHKADYQFDLAGHSQGEVRHNFHLDQTTNANIPTLFAKRSAATAEARHRMMFVVGKMVELELSLTTLASIGDGQEREQFAKDVGSRAREARDTLEEVEELLEDSGYAIPEEISKTIATVEEVKLKRRLDRTALREAAGVVEDAARSFAARYDGTEFSAIDELLPTRPRGTVYTP